MDGAWYRVTRAKNIGLGALVLSFPKSYINDLEVLIAAAYIKLFCKVILCGQ